MLDAVENRANGNGVAKLRQQCSADCVAGGEYSDGSLSLTFAFAFFVSFVPSW